VDFAALVAEVNCKCSLSSKIQWPNLTASVRHNLKTHDEDEYPILTWLRHMHCAIENLYGAGHV
jgi:hypothetical protein